MSKQSAIYPLIYNKRNTSRGCEIGPKPTMQTPERHHSHRYVAVIVNSVHISHPAAVSYVDSLQTNDDMVGIS